MLIIQVGYGAGDNWDAFPSMLNITWQSLSLRESDRASTQLRESEDFKKRMAECIVYDDSVYRPEKDFQKNQKKVAVCQDLCTWVTHPYFTERLPFDRWY